MARDPSFYSGRPKGRFIILVITLMFSIQLDNREKMIMFVRQSESLLIWPALVIGCAIYFPLATFIKYELLGRFAWYLLAWTVLIALYGINKYMLWMLNSYLVTSKRVIVVKYRSLFTKRIQEVEIPHIASISYESTGVFSSLFGFGNLVLENDRTGKYIILRNVGNAQKIRNLIQKVQTRGAFNTDSPDKQHILS